MTNTPLDILKALRPISESSQAPQEKLHQMLHFIRMQSKSDAVECFVLLDDTHLELFGADGAGESRIHQIFLSVRDGLIGEVARTRRSVNLADVKHHPRYVASSQQEDNFKGLALLPLIKWNRTVGVLVLKRQKAKEYTSGEFEILETFAMILSDFLVSDEVVDYKSALQQEKFISDRVKGLSLSKGYGIGQAVLHRRRQAANRIFTEDKEAELLRLEAAYQKMNQDLDAKFNATKLGIGEHVDILETYCMLAKDKGWYKKITTNVSGGLTAETAVERAYEDMWNRLSATSDQYLRERLHDLRDISDRLLNYLSGDIGGERILQDSSDIIVVAQTMGPADLMDYDYTKIRGLIIEDGTPTMHVAIVAKALNIPVIAKVKGVFASLKNGQQIAIDGHEGYIYINPDQIVSARIQAKIAEKEKLTAKLAELKNLPTETLDGQKVGLYINVGLSFDLDYLDTTGCDGVGLYRTEIPFMSSEVMPDVDRQISYYRDLYDRARDRRVIFRSLDAGSDKLLPYWGNMGEENPAIGWRSIRITLDRRAILRQQLRAFLRAAEGKELNVMFPMISDLSEFEDAKETLLLEIEKEKKKGHVGPSKINIGLMVEVPALVFQLDEVLPKTDFISIGTNDLAQFMFACDRGNPRLSERYDVLSAPFLRLMRDIIQKATKHHVYCSVCGEMAGNPIEAMVLLGLGYRNLSTNGASYGRIKSMIRSLNVSEVSDYVDNLLKSSQKTLRPQLLAYAYDHGIEIY